MDISQLIQENIKKAVKKVYDLDLDKVFVEHPVNEKWGDYSSNISLEISKNIKQSPFEIAKNLCYELIGLDLTFEVDANTYKIFDIIEPAQPGFINFKLSKEWLHYVLYQVNSDKENYGSGISKGSKRTLVEFSQPNPNKPLHIGHARNNFLGSSLSNILAFLGYDVIKANYMNDWGTHICKSMLMYKKYGNNEEPTKKSDHFVGDFYIMYEQKSADDPKLAEELAAMFIKLESGDPETVELWKKIVNWACEGWKTTYEDENVTFDLWMYQHDYKDSGKEIVQIALDRGIAEKDETGAVIARLEKYGIPDKVLLRSDGTSIYSTQDLQLAKDSFEKYNLDQRLYVVDFRQSDYFKQIFKILEILGFEWASKLHHVSYGVVKLPEGQMSSRTGTVINADDVFDGLVKLELVEVEKTVKDKKKALVIAKKVALAAFRYGLLKVDPDQDIVFDNAYVSRFDGNTGPYLMYTYARTFSVLEKSSFKFDAENFAYDLKNYPDLDPREEAVMRQIYKFPEEVLKAGESFAPNVLCNYLFSLAQTFNTMYAGLSILNAESENVKNLRLIITKSVGQILKNGLDLLGIEVVERM